MNAVIYGRMLGYNRHSGVVQLRSPVLLLAAATVVVIVWATTPGGIAIYVNVYI